jgi:hypothetical protein
MRCNFDRLIAYINDELDENQNHDVMIHLHDCNICREAVLEMLDDQRINAQVPHVSIGAGAGLPKQSNRHYLYK